MLSYKTIVAIQLLQAILDAEDKGYTVTELKQLTGLQGMAVSRVAFLLRKKGWVDLKRNSRYQLAAFVEDASLYDLVMVTDGRIQLATHVALNHWGFDADKTLGKAIKFTQDIHDSLKTKLQSVKIGNIIKVAGK